MKTYSLGNPPSIAGLYYLTNKKTGQVYVGKSNDFKRRYFEWKNMLSTGYGHRGKGVIDAIQSDPDMDNWFFVIAKEMPGATNEELVKAEAEEIARLGAKIPGKVMNGTGLTHHTNAIKSGGVSILTEDGGVVGVKVAARLLDRNHDTIRDKVRWLKQKGITQVKLEDLLLDRRKIPQTKNHLTTP